MEVAGFEERGDEGVVGEGVPRGHLVEQEVGVAGVERGAARVHEEDGVGGRERGGDVAGLEEELVELPAGGGAAGAEELDAGWDVAGHGGAAAPMWGDRKRRVTRDAGAKRRRYQRRTHPYRRSKISLHVVFRWSENKGFGGLATSGGGVLRFWPEKEERKRNWAFIASWASQRMRMKRPNTIWPTTMSSCPRP